MRQLECFFWRRCGVVFSVALCAALFSVQLQAQDDAGRGRRGRGLWGDWRIQMEINGTSWDSILNFSRSSEGQWTGQWISFFGISELEELSFEDGKLSFVQRRTNRNGESVTSKFNGTVAEGKLTGTLSGNQGETQVTGARTPWTRRAVGTWETKFKVGDREITNTLVITSKDGGELGVDWKSERVQHTISGVSYERGKLTFKTASKMDDREWQSSFEADLEGDALTGVIKSDRGEMAVTGKRIGAEAIGDWILDISSERGERKQRLRVNPDMSGLYGATSVSDLKLEDGKLSFKITFRFGDNEFETSFAGKIDGDSLTGELTSTRGTSKVSGKKAPPPTRRRNRPTDRTL